jgi:hypothetical protein
MLAAPRFSGLAVVVALAAEGCVDPADLAPFPCARDGGCPQGMLCNPDRQCVRGNVESTGSGQPICETPGSECEQTCCSSSQSCVGGNCIEQCANSCNGQCFTCDPGWTYGCGPSYGGVCCEPGFPSFCDHPDAKCWDVPVDCNTIVFCNNLGQYKACAPGYFFDCNSQQCMP